MTPLKKYIWLVDTLMRRGEKGLTLEQIGDGIKLAALGRGRSIAYIALTASATANYRY